MIAQKMNISHREVDLIAKDMVDIPNRFFGDSPDKACEKFTNEINNVMFELVIAEENAS